MFDCFCADLSLVACRATTKEPKLICVVSIFSAETSVCIFETLKLLFAEITAPIEIEPKIYIDC